MKKRLPYILTAVLFLCFFGKLIPEASAQSWLWGRQGVGLYMETWSVATDAVGNVFGVGSNTGANTPVTFGNITVPIDGVEQVVWVKYDPLGNVLWAGSTTSSTNSGINAVLNICTDPSGNLIIYGESSSASMQIGSITLTNPYYGMSSQTQNFLAKINPSGTVLWAVTGPQVIGGNVATDSAGNIYLASFYSGTNLTVGPYSFTNADPTGITSDILLAKYTPSGALTWATSIGGTSQDYAIGVTISSTGYVYVGGGTSSPVLIVGPSIITNSNSQTNALIAKFSTSGVPLWGQSGGGASKSTAVQSITSDTSGNVYLAGDFYDPSISFGATTVTSPFPNPSTSAFVVQYSPAGTVTWAKAMGSSTQGVSCYSVAASSCGKVWVYGDFVSDIVTDPGDTFVWAAARDPAFLIGYDLAGGPTIHAKLGCGGDDIGSIVCDPTGNVLLCEDFSVTISNPFFVVGPDSFTTSVLYQLGPEYMFVAKYGKAPDTTFAHKDTFACIDPVKGDTIVAPPGYASYYWDNGSAHATRNINGIGQYYVYCYGCGAVLVDTFNIKIGTVDTTAKDTIVCAPNGTASLSVPSIYTSFLWSTGDTTASIMVNTDGSYWVSASGGCSALLDTFNVKVSNIAFSLGKDSNACAPVTLLAPPFAQTHVWQDGSTSTTYTAGSTGTYSLSISNQGCPYADTVFLHVTDVSQHINDTLLCREQPVQLTVQANVPAGANVLWSDSSKQNTLYVKDTGNYWVTVTDSLCTGTDTFTVATEYCDCKAYVPNAFTPNADGKNDVFRPVFQPGCPISNYWFAIYNRWGQQVFLSKTPGIGWTGDFNGVYCEIGAYEWLLKYTGGTKNAKYVLKGDMTLLR